MTQPKTFKMFDCSTGHLSPTTREWLDRPNTCKAYGFMSRDTGYAISSHIGAEDQWPNHRDIPDDLLHVLRFANENHMAWVLFDADADLDLNLPYYSEESLITEMPDHLKTCATQIGLGNDYSFIIPEKIKNADLHLRQDRTMEDENYTIPEGQGAWISLAGVSVRIVDTGESVAITSFVDGFEDLDEIDGMHHPKSHIAEMRENFIEHGHDDVSRKPDNHGEPMRDPLSGP